MDKRVKVCVKTKHIRNGVQTDCEKCMMALAINDCLRPGFRAAVEAFSYQIVDNHEQEMDMDIQFSNRVCKAIETFDAHKSLVKPFRAFVNIPTEFLREDLK